MSQISNLDLLSTGTTVADLRRELAKFPPDAYLSFQEFRYQGGADEQFECDLVFWEHNRLVFIARKPDAAGLMHIQDEANKWQR